MPIDVSERLQELLFESLRAAVLTSATLAVDGGFTYMKDRLGIETDRRAAASRPPSTIQDQAVLYVPRQIPEPPSPGFVDHAAEEIVGLLKVSKGRAFVLFTSYANMNAVAERIAGRIDYPVFMQGEAPKHALLESFRETPHAVLLATASFWQGVDVVGEQLSCVVIDKLPFASPGDPVVAARIERLRAGTGPTRRPAGRRFPAGSSGRVRRAPRRPTACRGQTPRCPRTTSSPRRGRALRRWSSRASWAGCHHRSTSSPSRWR